MKAFDQSFSATINAVSIGSMIGVQLKAPLNFNYSAVETGKVVITSSSGDTLKLQLSETTGNSSLVRSTVQVSSADMNTGDTIIQVTPGGTITISYGFGSFKRSVTLSVN